MLVDGVYNVSHPGGIGFEVIDGCKTWHYERPGKDITEGAVSLAVECTALEGSCQEVWHPEEIL